jgi:hypothetical protein
METEMASDTWIDMTCRNACTTRWGYEVVDRYVYYCKALCDAPCRHEKAA